MKSFSKYIVQGIGIAIGVVIIIGVIIFGSHIKNLYIERQEVKQKEAQIKKELDYMVFIDMGLSKPDAINAVDHGVDIKKDGRYKIKVLSGKGDVGIYDMNEGKKIKTIDTVNENKVSEFEGKSGYKIVPEEGLSIECIRK